ncbi:MAG: UDP-N-acetylmuramoyl-tripeptide--D-alanyl-D-alanine ligase [Oscillibacter sp.]|nr:UDP-N-acetylmuramoyl-tripeptide--D-alanyl-D-alanine ligase [Oscillibacter sp.]
MRAMQVPEIAATVRGIWKNSGYPAPPVSAICTDSRNIVPGCLFIPIVGDRFDGHDYILDALDAGAAGCLFSRPPEIRRPDKFYIRVQDTRLALGALAAAWRNDFKIPFVQITGSVGKTTTKEMIASVLREKLRVLKTEGNLNNNIGVPLTLLKLAPGDEAAVIETGMNHFGEIEYLTSLVRPDIAVITNIGDAHIEFLGSREGVLKAKCEIFTHLREGGLAILNGDDPLLNQVAPPFRTIRCGYSPRCQARITDFIDRSVNGISCAVRTERGEYKLEVPAPGGYMAIPAAMAVAVGEALGLGHDEIVRGVANYVPAGSRMRVLHLPGNRIVLDDCYNANPQSVTAALEVLSRTECEKRVAVLGDMGELGGYAKQAHYNMGALTSMLGIDYVVAIGPRAVDIADGATQNGGDAIHFDTKEAAMDELKRQLEPNSAMLVKASHAMNFGQIVTELTNAYHD